MGKQSAEMHHSLVEIGVKSFQRNTANRGDSEGFKYKLYSKMMARHRTLL